MEKETKEIPIKYSCPVCGKWGRTMHLANLGKFYHCNPRARRGGKGCGEIFRRLEPACERHEPIWADLIWQDEEIKSSVDQRIEVVGFRMIEALKSVGLHDPKRRTFPSGRIHTLPEFKKGFFCDCGCGRSSFRTAWGEMRAKRFSSEVCSSVIYQAAYFIGNPGPDLTDYILRTQGEGCCSCGDTSGPFELDHIIEVNEGGGMCWLDNFQVLCSECHKDKTVAYARMRAKRTRARKKAEEVLRLGLQSLF